MVYTDGAHAHHLANFVAQNVFECLENLFLFIIALLYMYSHLAVICSIFAHICLQCFDAVG